MDGLAVSPLRIEARRLQDAPWLVAYCALFLATVVITGKQGSSVSTKFDTLAMCTNASTTAGYIRAGVLGDQDADDNAVSDIRHSLPYLGASFGLAVLFGIIWMALLRFFAKPIIYVTLIFNGVVLIALGVYTSTLAREGCALTTGDCSAAYAPYALVFAGVIYLLVLFCMRRRIELTAKLLEQAVSVVAAHPGLFLLSGGIILVKAAFLVLSLAALAFVALGAVTIHPDAGGVPGQCDISWDGTSADEVMLAAVTVFLYWTMMLWACVRFYVTSLTTGVWYYENASLSAQEGSLAAKDHTRAPICTGLRLALTKGLGTIAFASLVITVCEYLKRLARKETQNGGLLGCLIGCCITCILNYIEFLTSFALTFAALTGDGFCTSGRGFLNSCQKHGFLKVIVVDSLAGMTLSFGALVLGLVVGALTAGLVDASVLDGPSHDSTRMEVLAAVGTSAAVIGVVLLNFIASILLNVVDAAYCCIVLDLDNRANGQPFHRPAIAEAVLYKVKPDFVVVQSPTGQAYAVGQPQPLPVAQPVRAYAAP